jgi:MarR family transcriptional regulator, lower aerobic nicotinate degradation pathway regulator
MSPRPDAAPAPPQLDPVDGLAQLSFVIMGLLERRAAEQDLSIAATRLLGVLRDREPTMNELARLLDLDKSSVTGLVDRAERRGLVERAPSTADRRAVLVRLTDEGRSLVSAAGRLFAADVTAMLGLLAPRDRAALSRLVSRLLVAHAAEQGIDLFATTAPRPDNQGLPETLRALGSLPADGIWRKAARSCGAVCLGQPAGCSVERAATPVQRAGTGPSPVRLPARPEPDLPGPARSRTAGPDHVTHSAVHLVVRGDRVDRARAGTRRPPAGHAMVVADLPFRGNSAANRLRNYHDHGPSRGAGGTIRTEREPAARRGRRGAPKTTALPSRCVLSMPFDLMRHDLLMTLKPV